MQRITTHLWFDKEAKEAAELYVATFPQSKITSIVTLHDTPSGDVDTVSFELAGRQFQGISAGPMFRFNPSISFYVNCQTADEVDRIWARLTPGGMELMPLGAYPFSERFGWVQDRYGVSWQVAMRFGGLPAVQVTITPVAMFVGDVCGRAEEAIRFWTSVFPGGKVGTLMHHGKGEEPDKEGSLTFGAFSLADEVFGAMDSAYEHQFAFNEAISFLVNCDTQEEIDYFWKSLSAVPEAEQCGWLKDKFGVSWQIVPVGMEQWLSGDDRERIDRVTQAFLQMKKIDTVKLREVYEGR
jgi:predicted 3-demethylubiquinone-9 3-methyltransferase (glyoxalase superfamily)